MEQIQDRLKLGLGLEELGGFGLEQGVSLVRLVELMLLPGPGLAGAGGLRYGFWE